MSARAVCFDSACFFYQKTLLPFLSARDLTLQAMCSMPQPCCFYGYIQGIGHLVLRARPCYADIDQMIVCVIGS